MNVLLFSTLYPNSIQPGRGVFVQHRLRNLVADTEVSARVVAPIPWFPSQNSAFGEYAEYARVKSSEIQYGIKVYHPRYLVIPKVGMTITPLTLAKGAWKTIHQLSLDNEGVDLIDAHYFYPDGIAAALIAKKLRKPFVITARGTDINLIPDYLMPRKMIQWAAREANHIITVCGALKERLVELGISPEKITALRNGVDLELFRPADLNPSVEEQHDSVKTLLSVGYLIERKGHDIPIRALPALPNARLLIAGSGDEEGNLKNLCRQLGVDSRVEFLGNVSQEELRKQYCSADALVLASSREGWANVLLESMACGTPVIASNVWGTPEVVASPEAGVLMDSRTPEAFAVAYEKLFNNYPNRKDVRKYAEKFSWKDTSEGQCRIFRGLI